MADVRPLGADASGYEILTEAVRSMLNQFPGLETGEKVFFEQLGKDYGIAFFNNAGAVIYGESEDIIGGVHQTCQYPFLVIYRSTSTRENAKLDIVEFLEQMGKWLCKERVNINGTDARIIEYPALSDGWEIKKITRENAYGAQPGENGEQDWVLPVTVEYTHDFYK